MLGLLVCLKFCLMETMYYAMEKWMLRTQVVQEVIAPIVSYLQIGVSVQKCASVTNVMNIRRLMESM